MNETSLTPKKCAPGCLMVWDCSIGRENGWSSRSSSCPAMLCWWGPMAGVIKLFCLWRWSGPQWGEWWGAKMQLAPYDAQKSVRLMAGIFSKVLKSSAILNSSSYGSEAVIMQRVSLANQECTVFKIKMVPSSLQFWILVFFFVAPWDQRWELVLVPCSCILVVGGFR